MKKVLYKEAVEYLAQTTRADIACAMNSAVSLFSVNPGELHWEAVKWFLQYVKKTATKELEYCRNPTDEFEGYWVGLEILTAGDRSVDMFSRYREGGHYRGTWRSNRQWPFRLVRSSIFLFAKYSRGHVMEKSLIRIHQRWTDFSSLRLSVRNKHSYQRILQSAIILCIRNWRTALSSSTTYQPSGNQQMHSPNEWRSRTRRSFVVW